MIRCSERVTKADDGFEYVPDITEDLRIAVDDLKLRLKRCTVYLVGPMGSGKSVLGKYVAHILGFRFLDTDALCESLAQKSIADIFKESGEEAFRDVETAVLDEVQVYLNCIVSTGGGIVLHRGNWSKLQTGIVIYLNPSVDVLVERLSNAKDTESRPLLKGDVRERIETLQKERKTLYEQADVTVNIDESDMAVDEIALEFCRKLSNFIKEHPPKQSELYAADLSANKKNE